MLSYVLITPARNEARFIERTMESVANQTVLPVRWVIVDDGSSDGTGALVEKFAERHRWIHLVRRPVDSERNFASKALAFNAGYASLQGIPFDVIGNIDADISFGSDYFAFLMGRFEIDPELGVAGTIFSEEGYESTRDSFEGHAYVAGAVQLFRRQCFEEIGGYRPYKPGGVDWAAVTTARMRGWRTRAFTERSFFHHRPHGTAERGSALSAMFFSGQRDYFLGKHPIPQLFRVLYRASKRPLDVSALGLLFGYAWAMLLRKDRISPELIRFRQREDRAKMFRMIRSVLQGRRIDKFYLLDGLPQRKPEDSHKLPATLTE